MSRTNKSRGFKSRHGGGHHYRNKHLTEVRQIGNRWMRQKVRQRMKDVLFTDAFDEKRLPNRKADLFNRDMYD